MDLHFLRYFAPIFDLSDAIDSKEKEIHEAWRKSVNLPRKQKKSVRKELLLDYSINEWCKKLMNFEL